MEDAAATKASRAGDQVQAIASALRADILADRIGPGETLRQERIAERFGVSRMPVREAIRVLEVEGFVDIVANRGATVAEISRDELVDVVDMRTALEPLALRLAIPHLSNHQLDQAHEVQTRAEGAPLSDFGVLNSAFHRLLYEPCRRPRLLRQIEILQNVSDRYLRVAASRLDYTQRSHGEHRAILEACYRRDADAAVDTMASHIREAGTALSELLRPSA